MLKIVCGVFSFLAGFSSLGRAFYLQSALFELQQLNRMVAPNLRRQLDPFFNAFLSVNPSHIYLSYLFAIFFFILGVYLIRAGDIERRQALIDDLKTFSPPSPPADADF